MLARLRRRDYPGSRRTEGPTEDTFGEGRGDFTNSKRSVGEPIVSFSSNPLRGEPIMSFSDIKGLQGPGVSPRNAKRHIDSYREYRQIVGHSYGGRLFDTAAHESLRQCAADPRRRLWVHWVEESSGFECKAIGPGSLCFCGHAYHEHTWDEYSETKQLSCKIQGCTCKAYSYIPVCGAGDLKCTNCKQSFKDHAADTKSCPAAKSESTIFACSYTCNCNRNYSMHRTVVQLNAEREAAGKSRGESWMDAASAARSASAPMIEDKVDRALAGLEPRLDLQRAHIAFSEGQAVHSRVPFPKVHDARLSAIIGPIGSHKLPLVSRQVVECLPGFQWESTQTASSRQQADYENATANEVRALARTHGAAAAAASWLDKKDVLESLQKAMNSTRSH